MVPCCYLNVMDILFPVQGSFLLLWGPFLLPQLLMEGAVLLSCYVLHVKSEQKIASTTLYTL